MASVASVTQVFSSTPREEWSAQLLEDGTYACRREIAAPATEIAFREQLYSPLDAVAFFVAGREVAYFPARDFIDTLDDKALPDPSQPTARSELLWTPSSC